MKLMRGQLHSNINETVVKDYWIKGNTRSFFYVRLEGPGSLMEAFLILKHCSGL